MTVVGQPLDRVDGALKVTGAATFTAERALPRMCCAKILFSTVPAGTITSFNLNAAQHAPGVIAILTPDNAPRLPQGGRAGVEPPAGRVLSLLQDRSVSYNGQPIGVVIAESLEQATYAAPRVRVRYAVTAPQLSFEQQRSEAFAPKPTAQAKPDYARGDFDAALALAEVRLDQTYTTPMEHHNPLEPHATVALWEGDRLTVYDATQYVSGVQKTLGKILGISPDHIRVISPFVGGGFGCKGSAWSHVALAAMAARHVGRPVKLILERTEMFAPVGSRPQTEQRIIIGARRDGSLTALSHAVLSHTSVIEEYTEPSATVTRMLYSCPNLKTQQRLVSLNVGTPTFQRAPGEATGTFALEVALDELSVATGIDPIELRLRNYADKEPETGKPWSSKSLRECYRAGAERFGWAQRPAPQTQLHADDCVGYGMATATYPVNRNKASASAQYLEDGSAVVKSGSQELGTGTYTVMSQVASDALGVTVRSIRFELGDSRLPAAPVSGGSMTCASVAPAVKLACERARAELVRRATTGDLALLHGSAVNDVVVEDGWIYVRGDPSRRLRVGAVVAQGGDPVIGNAESGPGAERDTYAMHSFGAVFAEVHVDRQLGQIRVPRIVGRYGVGRLLNEKTGTSQLLGGIVWGISMALHEVSELDRRTGRIVNANLADYHVPVHADVGLIDVAVVSEDDPYVNSLGAKGIGEIGITGVAAAISNAVFNATGRRIRSLPITPDKLL